MTDRAPYDALTGTPRVSGGAPESNSHAAREPSVGDPGEPPGCARSALGGEDPDRVAGQTSGSDGWAALDWGASRPAPCNTSGQEGALVSLTGYCPTSRNHAESDSERQTEYEVQERLLWEYETRALLRPHAADQRIGGCGARVYTDPFIVTREFASGARRAHWSGIVLCNRMGCPVCGRLRAQRFGQQVQRTLGAGGLWQHVVMTVSHTIDDSWESIYERLLEGVRSLTRGTCGRAIMPIVEATIRATEATWSFFRGWHVHFHVLWRLRRELQPGEKELVNKQWAAETGADLEQGIYWGGLFDCSKSSESEQAAKYVSKMSLELAGYAKKASPTHWHIYEIYDKAAKGDIRFIDLVQQYQRATKGKRLYQFDRRAARIRDAAPQLPELVVTAEWRTPVYREEFAGLSRIERYGRDRLATYLPLEIAMTARGDPAGDVDEQINLLLQSYDSFRYGQVAS